MVNPWASFRWHHSVRDKFDEHLVFYRVRLNQFHPEKTKNILSKLFTAEDTTNLSVYVVFGSTDILIHGYLHRQLVEDFRFKLAEALGTETTPEYFAVSKRENHQFSIETAPSFISNPDLSGILEPQTIRTLQSGKNPELLRRLIEAGFVEHVDDFGEQLIRFFMALAMDTTAPHLDRAHSTVHDHLRQQKTLVRAHLYRGTGFAKFVIDGFVQPENYFTVGELSKWLIRQFDPYRATTETYLASESDPMITGPGVIDDRTFIARRFKSSFIDSIVPQVYSTASAISDQVIFVLSDTSLQSDALSSRDRALLGKFLTGVLDGDETLAATYLLLFLSQLEGYLRTSHAKYAALAQLNIKDIYDAAEVKDRNMTLISYFNTLIKLFERVGKADLVECAKKCHNLLPIRNKVAHGKDEFIDWQADLRTLITTLPSLRAVLEELARTTHLPFAY